MKSITRAALALAAMSGAAVSPAKADAPNLAGFISGTVFTAASTGNVTVTFLFSRAIFTNYLVLFDAVGGTGTTIMTVPGAYPAIGTPVGPISVDVAVTAGQTLLFGLCSDGATTGGSSTHCDPITGEATSSWYMGPGTNNADGNIHVAILDAATWNGLNDFCEAEAPTPCGSAPTGDTVVGFEDKNIPNTETDEPDYNDIVFAFSNVSVIPEPATMGLLAIGLVGMSGAGLLRRRNRKNNK
jgi:hypothetical protein